MAVWLIVAYSGGMILVGMVLARWAIKLDLKKGRKIQ